MFIYIYIHVCLHIFKYMYNIHMYICMYIYVHTCIYIQCIHTPNRAVIPDLSEHVLPARSRTHSDLLSLSSLLSLSFSLSFSSSFYICFLSLPCSLSLSLSASPPLSIYTLTHTYVYIYIYIYVQRVRKPKRAVIPDLLEDGLPPRRRTRRFIFSKVSLTTKSVI